MGKHVSLLDLTKAHIRSSTCTRIIRPVDRPRQEIIRVALNQLRKCPKEILLPGDEEEVEMDKSRDEATGYH